MYAYTLCAYQPHRGPDMLGYLYNIAFARQEFSLTACLAYDVAFRKKAAQLRLPSWGHIDPQLYSKAFTGVGKLGANAQCSLCLGTTHATIECPLYTNGPAKRAQASPAGPKGTAPSSTAGRFASTSIEANALGKTAHGRTHARSVAAVAPTPPSAACSAALPHANPSQHRTAPQVYPSQHHPAIFCSPLPRNCTCPLSQATTHSLPHPLALTPHTSPLAPNMVTPIRAQTLAHLLTQHPNGDFVQYLTRGFQFGFFTGYRGRRTARHAHNLPSA